MLGTSFSGVDLRPRSASGATLDKWSRQQTDTGKIYYYNRATGASQWHIPTEYYPSQSQIVAKGLSKSRSDSSLTSLSKGRRAPGSRSGKRSSPFGMLASQMLLDRNSPLVMPTFAKATRNIDVVTEYEIPATRGGTASSNLGVHSHALGEESADEELPDLATTDVLRVVMRSARGLRDTDFMPGVDKSDPYCVCFIEGHPETVQRSPVQYDCLDPVWNCEVAVGPYSPGDRLTFTIFDSDLALETGDITASGALCDSDDLLGTVTLDVADVLRYGAPVEYELDEAGDGIEAFVTVEISGPCIAFPDLLGKDVDVAANALLKLYQDIELDVLEAPPTEERLPSTVVSWDLAYNSTMYREDFFGAFEDEIQAFKEGDLIEVFPNLTRASTRVGASPTGSVRHSRLFTFSHISGLTTKAQTVRGRMVRYVHVKEKTGVNVRDGMAWRRIPRPKEVGFKPNRVCVFFDAENMQVCSVPRTG